MERSSKGAAGGALTVRQDGGLSRVYPSFWEEVEIVKGVKQRGKALAVDAVAFVCRNRVSRDERGLIHIEPREVALKLEEDTRGNAGAVALLSNNTHANRMGFQQAFRRGKYNDEGRLFFNDHGTAEIGEVQSAARLF